MTAGALLLGDLAAGFPDRTRRRQKYPNHRNWFAHCLPMGHFRFRLLPAPTRKSPPDARNCPQGALLLTTVARTHLQIHLQKHRLTR